MSIEWGENVPGLSSEMSHSISDTTLDNTKVLSMDPFPVTVRWEVPLALAMGINALHQFRLRLFAQSIGPRPSVVLKDGAAVDTFFEPGVVGKRIYEREVTIDPALSQLFAEGTAVSGGPDVNDVDSSGVYKIAVVMQHVNAGTLTKNSGTSDSDYAVMFRTP